jgi:hypothetical protein
MKAIITAISLSLIISIACLSQEKRTPDSLKVTFLFTQSNVLDSNGLILQVAYRNNTKNAIGIYQYLQEGDIGDRFYNIYIEMQKRKDGKFSRHAMRYYQNALQYSMEDSIRHYDLPKKELLPYSSDTIKLNLLNVTKDFLAGAYRFKAHLRVKTIKDESVYNDKNFETAPPVDKIEYISSQWLYFNVKKVISKARIYRQ